MIVFFALASVPNKVKAMNQKSIMGLNLGLGHA